MTAPHDLGPWDDLLQEVSLDELRPALQRACAALERQGKPVPRWVRWLGPWQADGDHAWERYEAQPGQYRTRRLQVWRDRATPPRWWFGGLGNLPQPYGSMREAMAAAHEDAWRRGFMFDGRMPEEAPAAEPAAPEPTEEAEEARAQAVLRGPGRRAGQHVWEELEVLVRLDGRERWLCRCTRCGMWRGLRQYVQPYVPRERVVELVREGQGLRRPGRCPGRRGP